MEITVAGKRVVLRESAPAGKWWPLLPALAAMEGAENPLEELEWPTVVALVQASVVEWELDGDPQDEESIAELDIFGQLLPLLTQIAAQLQERANALGEAS